MLWMILCILSLANASKCEKNEPLVSSISDMVRMGVTMVSRFINSKSPQTLSPLFNKLTQEIKMSQMGDEGLGNKFILLVIRLMGVDNQKVTSFAFDGFISIVYLINQILIRNGKRKREERTKFSFFRFILSQFQVDNLLTQMQDPKLFDLVLRESEKKLKYYPEENVDCIKVLICRTKPFVQEMQRSLRFFINRENIKTSEKETHEETCLRVDEDISWEKANLEDRMYFFVPSLKEVVECGDKCDQLFPNCIY